MCYDFETVVNRNNSGALKWDLMKQVKPDVGDDIVPFSVADMELKNPPEIISGLQEYLNTAVLGYTGATDDYYHSVCSYLKRKHNWEIKREWILVSPGVVPALYDIVKAFTKPNDGIIIMSPVYYPFTSAVQNSGRTLVKNSLICDEGRYTIDFADLELKAKQPENKLLILCSPHNPVGRVWTKDELIKLGRICIDNDVLIISDEIHFDFVSDGYKHTIFASISDEFAQNSIICTAPSKSYNLGGVQVSNIIIPNDNIRETLSKYNEETGRFVLNIFAYKIGEIAYTQCDEWFQQLHELLEVNKHLVEDFFTQNIPEITVSTLEGTYLMWLDCRKLGMDTKDLEHFMQQEAQLFLDEGYIFGDEGSGFERINIACPTKVLEEALNRLLKALKARSL